MGCGREERRVSEEPMCVEERRAAATRYGHEERQTDDELVCTNEHRLSTRLASKGAFMQRAMESDVSTGSVSRLRRSSDGQ